MNRQTVHAITHLNHATIGFTWAYLPLSLLCICFSEQYFRPGIIFLSFHCRTNY